MDSENTNSKVVIKDSKVVIKVITNNIVSFLGGYDGCSYMLTIDEALVFDSYESAKNHLHENFDVDSKLQHQSAILPTTFFIKEVAWDELNNIILTGIMRR